MNSNTPSPSTVRKQTAQTPSAPPATAWVQGLPSKPMSSEQQIEALRRVQVQAEQRVRLGNQLLSAAEARISANQQMLAEVRTEAERLQHEARQEMTTRLDEQDERLTQFENRLNRSMQSLERKVDALREDWTQTQVQLGRLLRQQGVPMKAMPREAAAPEAAAAPIVEQVVEQATATPVQSIDERPSSRLYADLLQQLRYQADSEPEIEDALAPPTAD